MHSTTRTTRVLLRCLTAAIAGITNIAAVTSAETDEYPVELFAAIGNYGPWGEPRAEFDASLANHPNATGSYPIPGPNISVPGNTLSSGNENTVDGWSWSIVVAADLPLENSSVPHEGDAQGPLYYTGEKMTFNAPSSLVDSGGNLTVSDDWQICLFHWSLDGFPYTHKLRSDNGTCRSVLTDKCIADIEEAAATSQKKGRCVCPLAKDIPSCRRLGDKSMVFSNSCEASSYNSSGIRGWEDGKMELIPFGDNITHKSGERERYNIVGSLAWPVMASFMNTVDRNSTASLSCVRAADAVAGSIAPTGDVPSGGTFFVD
ncbi:hypothetical protein F4824DRAFT_515420 [Ustulina deusta]|nr:hypothetical protein F4824DRAFT_515420 [Ustulina deusta]